MIKRKIAVAVIGALLAMPLGAFAQDGSWWGNTGATPEPVKDEVHPGYWWWPMDPDPDGPDDDLWGNRGCIYSIWEMPAPPDPEPTMAPEPPTSEPTTVSRVVPVFNNVLFDFDRADLSPASVTEIDKVVALMNEHSGDTVLVEGHTDGLGDETYNMGLGQRRSEAIKSRMVASGISAGRISTKSFGEDQPAVPNDSPANRALNRRGIFRYSIAE